MTQTIHVIDLGIGNLGSVINMLNRAGAQVECISDPDAIAKARKVILPGVGAFDALVQKIDAAGFRTPLLEYAHAGKYLLGICLGMQVLANSSEEGRLEGLGIVPGRVRRFRFEGENAKLKVPHMGWNRIAPQYAHPLARGLETGARFYFVHSYHFECAETDDVLFHTHYGFNFASAVKRGNVIGVQFHPEKSNRFGLQLTQNFVDI